MNSFVLEEYRKRITQETLATWNHYQQRGQSDKVAHLTQVLPLLARLDGHTDETALPQWINKHSAPSPDEKRDQIAGRIANEVLGMWYLPPQKSAYKHNRAVLQALQYLAAVEESSRRDTFVRYFQEKAHSSVEWERKATASAVAGIVGSISEPRVLLPILLTLIKDDNRTIRVHALAALLEMSSELGDQSLVIETLCAEMTLLRSGATYRQEILRELPLHAIEYTAHCKELLGNSLNDFVWAASAVVLGKIGSAARSKAVLAELEHGLASSLFLVQRLTAETFVHLNADDELKTKLLSVVQTAPKTEERCIALRKLGALGAVSPQDRTALNFLTAATAHPDLDIRAEAILSLVFYSQMDFDAHPEIRSHIGEHLQGLQQNAIWLLQPLIKEVAANFARQVTLAGYEQAFAAMGKTDWQREALTRSLQGWSRREMSECLIQTLRADAESGSPAPLRRGQSLTGVFRGETARLPASANLLYLEWVSNDTSDFGSMEARQRHNEIRDLLLKQPKSAGGQPVLECILWQNGLIVLTRTEADALAHCAIELSKKYPQRLRIAMHHDAQVFLSRTQTDTWLLEGEGLTVTREIAHQGKPGNLLLSEEFKPQLSAKYAPYLRPFGQHTSAKRFQKLFLLYSAQHQWGEMDIQHVPANRLPFIEKPDPVATRKHFFSIIYGLILVGIIVGVAAYSIPKYIKKNSYEKKAAEPFTPSLSTQQTTGAKPEKNPNTAPPTSTQKREKAIRRKQRGMTTVPKEQETVKGQTVENSYESVREGESKPDETPAPTETKSTPKPDEQESTPQDISDASVTPEN